MKFYSESQMSSILSSQIQSAPVLNCIKLSCGDMALPCENYEYVAKAKGGSSSQRKISPHNSTKAALALAATDAASRMLREPLRDMVRMAAMLALHTPREPVPELQRREPLEIDSPQTTICGETSAHFTARVNAAEAKLTNVAAWKGVSARGAAREHWLLVLEPALVLKTSLTAQPRKWQRAVAKVAAHKEARANVVP